MDIVDYGTYLVPLLVAKQVESPELRLELLRYAGVAFYVGANGRLATCKHVVESVGSGERLVAQNLTKHSYSMVHGVRAHPTFDFALIGIDHSGPTAVPLFHDSGQLLGIDVQALGFTSDGRIGKDLKVVARMFKGSVVRHDPDTRPPGGLTTVELSFPSHKGFSGAPVIVGARDAVPVVGGMLFTNAESTIELYSYTEARGAESSFRERIYRVVELGLMHPMHDIRRFMLDLEEPLAP